MMVLILAYALLCRYINATSPPEYMPAVSSCSSSESRMPHSLDISLPEDRTSRRRLLLTASEMASASEEGGIQAVVTFGAVLVAEGVEYIAKRGMEWYNKVGSRERPSKADLEMMKAVYYGDTTLVRELIKEEPLVSNAKVNGETALMLASRDGALDIVKVIIGAGADLNAASRMGETALSYATRFKRNSVLEYLLSVGADHATKDVPYGRSPLGWTCYHGHYEETATLLRYGADVEHADLSGITPLMVASSEGRSHLIPLLISHKCTLNTRDSVGQTALFHAAYRNHPSVLKHLLLSGADPMIPSNSGELPLDAVIKRAGGQRGRALLVHFMAIRANLVGKWKELVPDVVRLIVAQSIEVAHTM